VSPSRVRTLPGVSMSSLPGDERACRRCAMPV
jgi:hypothetical protein